MSTPDLATRNIGPSVPFPSGRTVARIHPGQIENAGTKIAPRVRRPNRLNRQLRLRRPELPKQNDEELPIGEDGHTRAPDHTRDRMGYFPSVAFWNWRQPSTDWFNLATGEALAEYNPSPAMRELVAGIESQEKVMKHSRGEYVPLPERFNLPTGEAEVKKRRPRMRADSHLSESAGKIVHITVETLAPTRSRTAPTRENIESERSNPAPTRENIESERSITDERSVARSPTHRNIKSERFNPAPARKKNNQACKVNDSTPQNASVRRGSVKFGA